MKYYGAKKDKDNGFYLEPFEGSVEITDEYWQELLDAQCTGKRIQPDGHGRPQAVENIPSQVELSQVLRARRDKLLFSFDWTQLPDAHLSDQCKKKYQAYRQALRDLPFQSEFPNNVTWPEMNFPN